MDEVNRMKEDIPWQRFSLWRMVEHRWLGGIIILLLSLFAYSNSFPGAFLLDDVVIVRENPLVQDIDLASIFTSDYWGAASNTGLHRPITILSFALNKLLLGPNPAGYHLVNLFLHAGVSLLVFVVLERWGVERRLSWLSAAIFAVHPLHTEVVNEVVGRSELLVAVFLLLALLFAKLSVRWAGIGVLVCFALALLSKEHAIVFLAVLPLLDWFVTDVPWRSRRWSLYLASAAMVAGWLFWRSWAVVRVPAAFIPDPVMTPMAYLAPLDRWVSALQLQGLYVWKLLFPWPLQAFYADADVSVLTVKFSSMTGVVVVVVTSVVVGLLVWGLLRRSSVALFALLYLVAFLPTANIIFVTEATFAERLAYFPSVWFCALLVVGTHAVGRNMSYAKGWGVLSAVFISVLLVLTLMRNPDFASSLRLWEANVQVAPRNVVAMAYLASSYELEGNPAAADAIYQRLLALSPGFPYGLRNYAGFLLDAGRPFAAIPIALRATQVPEGRSPLSYLTLAESYYKVGDYASAREVLETIASTYGHTWYTWVLQGKVAEAVGDDISAIEAYHRAQPWPPGTDLPGRMGMLLLRHGQSADAESLLRTAAEENGSAAIWNGLGVALVQQGRNGEAAQAFLRAIDLDPEADTYRKNYRKVVNE